jgi:hypothetical protein
MKRQRAVFHYAVFFVFFSTAVLAAGETGESVLGKSHMFGSSPYLSMKVAMDIGEGAGEKQREIDIKINNEEGEYKIFMQITSPAFLRKMKFLQHHPKSGEALQWIATSRGTRKVTGSAEDAHIFDSDFTASDFAAINSGEYRILDFSHVQRDGYRCFRLEIEPREKADMWPVKVLYIDEQSRLIREVEYRRNGEVGKRYKLLATQQISGTTLPRESIMEDLLHGSSTRLTFAQIEMPASLPDRIFHYRNL